MVTLKNTANVNVPMHKYYTAKKKVRLWTFNPAIRLATILAIYSVIDNEISDAWVTWERISHKLIFWWRVKEVRLASWKFRIIYAFCGKIKSFYVGQSCLTAFFL